jgi:hypothetical protein
MFLVLFKVSFPILFKAFYHSTLPVVGISQIIDHIMERTRSRSPETLHVHLLFSNMLLNTLVRRKKREKKGLVKYLINFDEIKICNFVHFIESIKTLENKYGRLHLAYKIYLCFSRDQNYLIKTDNDNE